MAITDATDGSRTVIKGDGECKVTLAATCKVGDVLGYSSGWKPALATGGGTVIQGRLVAGQRGDSADVIVAYRKATLYYGSYAGTAGNTLYVAEGTATGGITDTAPSSSADASTIIGYVASSTTVILEPGSRSDATT